MYNIRVFCMKNEWKWINSNVFNPLFILYYITFNGIMWRDVCCTAVWIHGSEAMKRGNLNAQMCLYMYIMVNVCKQKEMKKIVSFYYIFLSYTIHLMYMLHSNSLDDNQFTRTDKDCKFILKATIKFICRYNFAYHMNIFWFKV